tara:strand:+ start:3973 stop:4173 length:201 start_codon:yes stop_codon:yes gene_type:complete
MPKEGVQDNSSLGVMQQIRQHDEDLLLAAEAFTYGVYEEYLAAQRESVSRKIRERYNTRANSGGGG